MQINESIGVRYAIDPLIVKVHGFRREPGWLQMVSLAFMIQVNPGPTSPRVRFSVLAAGLPGLEKPDLSG